MAEADVSAAHRMRRLMRFIDHNLGERLTLVELAAVLQLSPYHFAHIFKRATGLAPHQYLIERRLARAKHFLETTDLPIAEVALAVGCANQSHFSALFNRATGMTPLTYRVRHRASSLAPQVCDIPPANRRASFEERAAGRHDARLNNHTEEERCG